MILLDTNAVIYFLQNDNLAVDTIDRLRMKDTLAISTITELEIFSFANLGFEQLIRIEAFLKQIRIIPLDSGIARMSAQLRQTYNLKTPDAAVCGTAVFYGMPIVSRDRIFKKIKEITLIEC